MKTVSKPFSSLLKMMLTNMKFKDFFAKKMETLFEHPKVMNVGEMELEFSTHIPFPFYRLFLPPSINSATVINYIAHCGKNR
ncbi:hypothetical protein SAMN05421820_103669 [Pedobacter steynii]|uniref:Uncharacterized protein n=1 Tax=Pedobacter steynii TaxID=430522 RepID=A0A1G9SPV4_9SPHI|nr:hypothetical protein [Pedobacter steynii]NQX37354.1 hypothetical protein [Pedobacter steynii]SDM37442.1 hypothetical protein SAMN05421820_103669 [Pedobacter steynii]